MAIYGSMNGTILAICGIRNKCKPLGQYMAPETDHFYWFMATDIDMDAFWQLLAPETYIF